MKQLVLATVGRTNVDRQTPCRLAPLGDFWSRDVSTQESFPHTPHLNAWVVSMPKYIQDHAVWSRPNEEGLSGTVPTAGSSVIITTRSWELRVPWQTPRGKQTRHHTRSSAFQTPAVGRRRLVQCNRHGRDTANAPPPPSIPKPQLQAALPTTLPRWGLSPSLPSSNAAGPQSVRPQ
jgi:hypothetical protein